MLIKSRLFIKIAYIPFRTLNRSGAVLCTHVYYVALTYTYCKLPLKSYYYYYQHNHSSEQSAVQQVKEGRAWAAVVIGENFTVDLFKRVSDHSDTSVIKGSTIYLYMDVTSECLPDL